METHGLTVTTVTHETFVARETNLGTGENVVERAHLPVQQADLFARKPHAAVLGSNVRWANRFDLVGVVILGTDAW